LLRLPLSLLRLPPPSLLRLGWLGVLGAGALGGGAGGGELGCTLGGLAGSGRVISGFTSCALAIAADAHISAAKLSDNAPTLIF
jgi:hypothetical protein